MSHPKPNSLELIQDMLKMTPVVAGVFEAMCNVVAKLAQRIQDDNAVISEYEEAIQLSELRFREGVYGKLWD